MIVTRRNEKIARGSIAITNSNEGSACGVAWCVTLVHIILHIMLYGAYMYAVHIARSMKPR